MFKIEIRGNKELEAKLKRLPYGYKRIAVNAAADYILGDDKHGLKYYPPVTTQKYIRTFALKQGWQMKDAKGNGYTPVLYNYVPYTPYVPRWKQYGWREWAQVVADNMAGALRHAQAQVNAWLKSGWR